ncbi:MAG TPA: DUF433 domain-containing protein [Thermoanaerobaculia bacterium]
MLLVPGIVFSTGAAGRRAVLAGTGLDVWEVVATWRETGEEFTALQASYPWLAEPQLRAALGYHRLYPEEVDERLRREEEWTPERVRAELPFAVPRTRNS